MSKNVLSLLGLLSLIIWTGGGVAAWALTKEGVHITIQEGSSSEGRGHELASLEDRFDSLQKDLQTLTKTLGINFGRLQNVLKKDFQEESQNNSKALASKIQSIQAKLDSIQAEENRKFAQQSRTLEAWAQKLSQTKLLTAAPKEDKIPIATGSTHSQENAPSPRHPKSKDLKERFNHAPKGQKSVPLASKPITSSPLSKEPPKKEEKKGNKPKDQGNSFLSFTLPSQKVRFDKRLTWTLIPSLSRVGFDGKSTLHDFSGVTSDLSGSLEAKLSHPSDHPKAIIKVRSKMLKTGISGRDEEMYSTLAVNKYPEIRFSLLSFQSKKIDPKHEKVVGIAHGKMSIHGISKEVDMPTTLFLDSSRRLHVEGEMPMDITDYKIVPPSKLGFISMNKMVKVWIRLRARVKGN